MNTAFEWIPVLVCVGLFLACILPLIFYFDKDKQ